MEHRILEPAHPDISDRLESLNTRLVSLLQLTESGRWDDVAAATDTLVAALADLREAPLVRAGSSLPEGLSKKFSQTQDLLQKALSQCSERQSQISPLLEALSKAGNRSRQT